MNYREALEFIGEVRGGISWERFCIQGVRHSDAFIDILNDGEDTRKFLSSAGISREYLADQIKGIFYRLHFNRENDHYLTLALAHDASEPQIHKRWKELMLLYHPDRNGDEEAAPCAARINEAYSILKSPEKRMEYDRSARQSPEGHRLKEMKNFRAPRPKEYIIESPRTRRVLSKLIIPSCIVIAGVILLVTFLENREVRYVYHSASSGRGNDQRHALAEKARAREAKEQTKQKVEAEVKGKEETKAKTEVKEKVKVKEEPKEKVKAEVKEQTKAKAEIKVKEEVKAQGQTKEQVKVKEEPKEKAKAEAKEQTKQKVEAEVKGKEQTKAKTEVKEKVKVKEEPKEKVKEQTRQKVEAEVRVKELPREDVKPKAEVKAEEQIKDKTKAEAESVERAAAQFMSRYARAYEEGDIDKFMSFFSVSVVENGKMNYEEIRKAYKKNFENSRYRYSLKNVQFRKNGDDVIVTASYLININRSAETGDLVQGDIRWTLCREGGGLKITKVDYERR